MQWEMIGARKQPDCKEWCLPYLAFPYTNAHLSLSKVFLSLHFVLIRNNPAGVKYTRVEAKKLTRCTVCRNACMITEKRGIVVLLLWAAYRPLHNMNERHRITQLSHV